MIDATAVNGEHCARAHSTLALAHADTLSHTMVRASRVVPDGPQPEQQLHNTSLFQTAKVSSVSDEDGITLHYTEMP